MKLVQNEKQVFLDSRIFSLSIGYETFQWFHEILAISAFSFFFLPTGLQKVQGGSWKEYYRKKGINVWKNPKLPEKPKMGSSWIKMLKMRHCELEPGGVEQRKGSTSA